jgi:HD-GYP domain-containing protein (c-di-GMP phosphodiesterase class II)
MTVPEALETLRVNAGTQFDAELVEAFIALQETRAVQLAERAVVTAVPVAGSAER